MLFWMRCFSRSSPAHITAGDGIINHVPNYGSSSIRRWTSGPLSKMRLPSSSGGFPSRTAPKSRIWWDKSA